MTRFFTTYKDFVLIALGERDGFCDSVSANRWCRLFEEAEKQSLLGVLFSGVERLPKEMMPPQDLLLEWIGTTELIEAQNKQQFEKVQEISELFKQAGIRSCLLKGQSMALLYPNPLRRQTGDIDLWVDCDRNVAIAFCKERWNIDHVDVKNIVINNIPDVHLEVHLRPSWFYNPFTDKRFKSWYRQQRNWQFENLNEKGFCSPTISFNIIYCLVHIYKHLFDEGIGMRQLMDYYYILMHSVKKEREEAFALLKNFRMADFCAAVMYVMVDLFALKESYLLCQPKNRLGAKLLKDIVIGGNFGQYDKRNAHGKENRLTHGMRNIRHNLALLWDYPSEVLWSPIWKCWHWLWRKKHGYL